MLRKKILPLLLVLSMLCGTAAFAQEETRTVTFLDDLDREVTVEQPRRVAVLIGSFAHIWYLAGGGDTIVAAANDTWTSFDIPLSQDVLNLGATKEVSLEGVIASQPDFVIASVNTAADLLLREPLEAMDIPVAYFQVSTFSDYLHMLDICTQITGDREAYAQYGQQVSQQIDSAREKIDGSEPTALYIRVSGSGCKVKNSSESVLGEMLKDLGAVNIADNEESLLEALSMETILVRDPEYIFVVLQSTDPSVAQRVLQQTLLSDPAWSSLTAVQEGRYYIMDPALYNLKPNDRWGIAYEQLAQLLYPQP